VESGFRFVADLDSSLAPAAEPSGDGDISIGGGAGVIRQALAGNLDDPVISTAPVILGAVRRVSQGFDPCVA
jgi:dihydrofolate reductase